MSSLVVVCARDNIARYTTDELRRCALALAPDNITPNPPSIHSQDGLDVVVVNPVPGLATHGHGVCLGRMFGRVGEWWTPGSEAPDGSYVMARYDDRGLEVLTDILASRPLWYVQTPDLFLASTSQRALVMLLRRFELDPEAVTWMLASGHLGPTCWDGRFRRLPGDCCLRLDRRSWRLQTRVQPPARDVLRISDVEHIARLRQAILDTCASLNLPCDEWLLPLSGGLDSRVLLLGLLLADERPRCVTWGLRSSLLDAGSDACIARELAQRYGLEHSYWPTDGDPDSVVVAMERFLALSEGQVSEFGGYGDGMAMWKAFFEDGVAGVIRGDEPGVGFYDRYDSELQILRRLTITFVSEYPVGHPVHRLGLVEQRWDERLKRRLDESLALWNGRLYEDLKYPARLAPLNAIKGAYVEVVNPLLSRRVTEVVRCLPDRLHFHRRPLTTIVQDLGPPVPTAKSGASGQIPAFWEVEPGKAAIASALSADSAERALDRPALDLVLAGLARPALATPAGCRRAGAVKSLLPTRVIDRMRPVWPLRLSDHKLAFRAYVVVQTTNLLTKDATLLVGRSAGR